MSLWQLPAWFAWLLASMAAMVVLATGWLARAATGQNTSASTGNLGRAWWWGLVAGVPLLAVALYAGLGHPVAANPALRQHDNAAQTMVDKLAARLQANPDDLPGWLFLARSHKVLGKLNEADRAYRHAQALAVTQVDDLTDWIQVRVDLADGRFDAETQSLLTQAEALAPDHDSVWLFKGLLAIDQGRYPQAIRHLTTLRSRYEVGSADHEALTQVLAQLEAGQDPRRKPQPMAGEPRP